MYRSKKLGDLGESLAERFLAERGYEIIARNWRCRRGEIDLICRKEGQLIFVEVKLRAGAKFGPPEDSVNIFKMRRFAAAVGLYLAVEPAGAYRVDAILISFDAASGKAQISHLTNLSF